jgi:hypothetical protein
VKNDKFIEHSLEVTQNNEKGRISCKESGCKNSRYREINGAID